MLARACYHYLLTRVSEGHDIRVSFFDVQDARMSRVQGCTGAALGTSFLDKQKRSTSPVKGETHLKGKKTNLF